MNAEQIKKTRSYKLEMLRTADHCYRRACDTHQEYVDEEEWLYHYMLGKVAEKLQRPPDDYLDQYRKVMIQLCIYHWGFMFDTGKPLTTIANMDIWIDIGS